MSDLKQTLINLRDEIQQFAASINPEEANFINTLDLKICIHNLNRMIKHLQFIENIVNSAKPKGKQK